MAAHSISHHRQLMAMGVREDIAKNAVELCQGRLDVALEWCTPEKAAALQNCLDTLHDFGFSRADVLAGVLATGETDVDRVVNWIVDRDPRQPDPSEQPEQQQQQSRDSQASKVEANPPNPGRINPELDQLIQNRLSSSDKDIPPLHEIPRNRRTFVQQLLNIMDRRRVLLREAKLILLRGTFVSKREYLTIKEGFIKLLVDLDTLQLPQVVIDGEERTSPEWRSRRRGFITEADRLGDRIQKLWNQIADSGSPP